MIAEVNDMWIKANVNLPDVNEVTNSVKLLAVIPGGSAKISIVLLRQGCNTGRSHAKLCDSWTLSFQSVPDTPRTILYGKSPEDDSQKSPGAGRISKENIPTLNGRDRLCNRTIVSVRKLRSDLRC
jgi:hypothetical protein